MGILQISPAHTADGAHLLFRGVPKSAEQSHFPRCAMCADAAPRDVLFPDVPNQQLNSVLTKQTHRFLQTALSGRKSRRICADRGKARAHAVAVAGVAVHGEHHGLKSPACAGDGRRGSHEKSHGYVQRTKEYNPCQPKPSARSITLPRPRA